MDVIKCLAVLVVLCFDGSESDGHHGGHHHHSHLKIHLPEFIHHDHHTKVITIHHHHSKPKEHHHHHHHHHVKKIHIPHGHHYHHKKTTHTVAKGHTVKHGHGHHGHKHHGHGHHGHGHHGHGHHGHGHHGHHHGHHGYHGHHSHHHGHHDYPSVNYDSPSDDFEEEYTPYTPPVSFFGGGTPQVHGIQHTVQQVKVYDSLPGSIPSVPNTSGASPGYQVTEDEGDDEFTSVNSIQNSFPDTFGYLRGADGQPSHDPFEEIPQATIQTQQDQFLNNAKAFAQPTSSGNGMQGFTPVSHNPFASSAPTQVLPSVAASPELVTLEEDGFSDPANSYVGDVGSTPLLSVDEAAINDDTPVSYHREAGVQQVIQTGGMESVTY